jgi:hypothetical protein
MHRKGKNEVESELSEFPVFDIHTHLMGGKPCARLLRSSSPHEADNRPEEQQRKTDHGADAAKAGPLQVNVDEVAQRYDLRDSQAEV